MNNEMNVTLTEVMATRDKLIELLQTKRRALLEEQKQMMEAYAEDIGSIDVELRALGVGVAAEQPSDIGVKAYNYLKETAGTWVQAGALMRAVRAEGAVAAVVLSSLLRSGKVETRGEKRGTQYRVPSPATEAQQRLYG